MTQATVVGAPNIAPHMLSKFSLSHFFSHRVSLSTDQTVMNDMLQEICKALLQADVNVAAVKKMREAIKNNVDVEALAGGLNKRKMLEQAVCNELCSMLDPGKEPYNPKKKQPNVIMFVGLQGAARRRRAPSTPTSTSGRASSARSCAPTPSAGAFDQLKQNATKAKIPSTARTRRPTPRRLRGGVSNLRRGMR